MIFDDLDLFTAGQLRNEVAGALRRRRDGLAGDLVPLVTSESDTPLSSQTARRIAQLILEMLAVSVESAGRRTVGDTFRELQHLAAGMAGTRQVFSCVHLCERAVLDELALDEALGVISQPWPQVSHMVRQASFDVVAEIAEGIAAGTDQHAEDRLTTLISKPFFHIALEHELNRARRRQQPLSIILLDVTNLPQIITEYGYSVGDRVLERLAILVRRFFRDYDWVARHGANSIAILLPETSVQGATDLAVRVRETIEQRLVFSDLGPAARVHVTLSATAVGTEPVEAQQDAATVLAAAEQGLRRAKAAESRRVERVKLTSSGVTILDVAAALRCTPFMVRRLVREGHLTTERRGRHVYIHRRSLDRYRDAAESQNLVNG